MAEEGGGMDGGEHDVVQQVDGSEVIQVKDADDEGGKVLEEQGAEDVEKGEDAIKDDDESKQQHEIHHLAAIQGERPDDQDGMITVVTVNPDGTMQQEHEEHVGVGDAAPGEEDGVVGHHINVNSGLDGQEGVENDEGIQSAMDESFTGSINDGKDDGRRKRKRALSEPMDIKSEQKIGRYVVNDTAYNSRGYKVCGFVNQRGTLCGRIGNCPFHSKVGKGGEKEAPDVRRMSEPVKEGDKSIADCHGVMRLAEPPEKKRFKQSWTQEEHHRFLEAMRRFGKGNWKKIAEAVGTRTANQCQSHSQKYFLRQRTPREQRKKKSIHDAPDGLDHNGTDDPSGIHRLSQIAVNAGNAQTQGQNGSVAAVPIMLPLGGLGPGGVQGFPMGVNSPSGLMSVDQAALNAAVNSAAMQPQKMRVTVHRNGESHGGKAIILPNSLEQFFRLASDKLDAKNFCRAFTRSGGEISTLDELCHDDTLWLSEGQDFIFPPTT